MLDLIGAEYRAGARAWTSAGPRRDAAARCRPGIVPASPAD
jgi:hypothetical protein